MPKIRKNNKKIQKFGRKKKIQNPRKREKIQTSLEKKAKSNPKI